MRRIIVIFTLISFIIYISGCGKNKWVKIEEINKYDKVCAVETKDDQNITFNDNQGEFIAKSNLIIVSKYNKKSESYKLDNLKNIIIQDEETKECSESIPPTKFKIDYQNHIRIIENYKINSVLLNNDSLLNFMTDRADYVRLSKSENKITGVLKNKEPIEISLDSVKGIQTGKKMSTSLILGIVIVTALFILVVDNDPKDHVGHFPSQYQ